jgi:hypothetical protein
MLQLLLLLQRNLRLLLLQLKRLRLLRLLLLPGLRLPQQHFH